MQNTDPLRIFTADEINDLSIITLPKYRKQKLLLFQLSNSYTIELNGYSLDKNTIIAIFSDLEKTLQKPKTDTQLAQLNAFIKRFELSKLHLFYNIKYESIFNTNKDDISKKIADKVSENLAKEMLNGSISPSDMILINEFASKYLYNYKKNIYDKTYTELIDYIKLLRHDVIGPFPDENKPKLNPRIGHIVNGSFKECLFLLPHQFEPVRKSFSSWCYKHIAMPFEKSKWKFKNLNNQDQSTLKKVNEIAEIYNKPETTIKKITKYCYEIRHRITSKISRLFENKILRIAFSSILAFIAYIILLLLIK